MKKRGVQNRRELAAVATGIDLRFSAVMCFRKSAGASHCRSFLPSAARPLYSFLRKRSSRNEHMPNRRQRAREEICYSSENSRIGLSMEAENRNGHYAPAERRNRDHEILTLLRTASRRSTPFDEIVHAYAPINNALLHHMDVTPVIFGACKSSIWFNQPRFVCQPRTYSWFRNFAWD